jgi:hypothetical protein
MGIKTKLKTSVDGVSQKVGDRMDVQKIDKKIKDEEKAIANNSNIIGRLVVERLLSGGTFDMELINKPYRKIVKADRRIKEFNEIKAELLAEGELEEYDDEVIPLEAPAKVEALPPAQEEVQKVEAPKPTPVQAKPAEPKPAPAAAQAKPKPAPAAAQPKPAVPKPAEPKPVQKQAPKATEQVRAEPQPAAKPAQNYEFLNRIKNYNSDIE